MKGLTGKAQSDGIMSCVYFELLYFNLLEAIHTILECQPGDIRKYMNEKEYKKMMKIT